jgi:hypothetical protein
MRMTKPCPDAGLARVLTASCMMLATVACTGVVGPVTGTEPSTGSPMGGSGAASSGVGGDASAPSSGLGGGEGGMPLPLVTGRAPLRRLTRVEYNNTVRALLNDTSNPASQFEPDTLADGFTNNADTQNVGTTLAGEYLAAAEALSVTATKDLPTLLGCNPVGAETACLRSFIQQFGQRAWRRPLTTQEVDQVAGVYATGRLSFDIPTSTQMVVQTFLLSPYFLYRVELGVPAAGATVLALTSWEMASRLSYFLLGSMPDSALFAAAQQDTLRTPQQVSAQAQRLVSTPGTAAQDRFAQFFTEWLHLINIDTVQKDVVAFPSFTPSLGPLLRQETETFVKRTLFGGPGDLVTLLTAPYTYAAPEVVQLYGAPPAAADGRVTLNPKERAGLLTQPAFLATFAKASTTDPVRRGKFIWEGLFCGAVPPPPANLVITAPMIPPGTTTRQAFEAHRAAPACAACHKVMDPIGLTLENFDALGRWRDTENGVPIDVSGTLTGTDVDGPFVGPVELAQKLAASQGVANCVVRQFFRFGFGRYDTAEDAPTTDSLTGQFRTGKENMLDLAVSMTQVPAFLQLPVPQ